VHIECRLLPSVGNDHPATVDAFAYRLVSRRFFLIVVFAGRCLLFIFGGRCVVAFLFIGLRFFVLVGRSHFLFVLRRRSWIRGWWLSCVVAIVVVITARSKETRHNRHTQTQNSGPLQQRATSQSFFYNTPQ